IFSSAKKWNLPGAPALCFPPVSVTDNVRLMYFHCLCIVYVFLNLIINIFE
ncbi:hypothetical protein NDU88_003327, partial [Pleurodeles waltl]